MEITTMIKIKEKKVVSKLEIQLLSNLEKINYRKLEN